MTVDEVVRLAENHAIQQTQFLYVDNGGTIRGKVSSLGRLASHMRSGIGLTRAMQAMNLLDQLQPIPDLGPVGEIRLVPDPNSFRILPYLSRSASMMCQMLDPSGQAWNFCPRTVLLAQIERAEAMGFRVMATYEDEFSLARPTDDGQWVPLDDTVCFSSQGMVASHAVIEEIMDALEAQGIRPEQYYPELGHGQHELSISPGNILEAADNQVRYRETVRAVAARHGLRASFAPKPWQDQAGNGAHIHFSVWDKSWDHNLFWSASDRYHLSEMGYQFAAGVLAHLPALLALTCASVNSYRRLNPKSWSSAYTAFGPDNREAAVRIASVFWGNEERSINLELKASDSSANPYLALGALLAAGIDGIERRMAAPKPVLVDPSTLGAAEREALNIRRLPEKLDQSLAALRADKVLTQALGDPLLKAYATVKESEVDYFADKSVEEELHQHFSKF